MSKMIKAFIDLKTLQAKAHIYDGELRLETFLRILEEEDYRPNISEIPEDLLKMDYDLLIIPTRCPENPFNNIELDNIYNFARLGNNLLLMSNHRPYNFVDSMLTEIFGFAFECTYFETSGRLTYISDNFLENHPIVKGQAGSPEIKQLVTNNTCSIKKLKTFNCGEKGQVIAYLTDSMNDREINISSKKKIFALALDGKKDETDDVKGRIVMIADSGFIGRQCSTKPGLGLIEEGDNKLFIRRILRWFKIEEGE